MVNVHNFYLFCALISQMNCSILNIQKFQCPNGKLKQISSFNGLEFRDFFIRNGIYYSRTFDKQRSLSQVQISDNPEPRFVDGKWIRGNV